MKRVGGLGLRGLLQSEHGIKISDFEVKRPRPSKQPIGKVSGPKNSKGRVSGTRGIKYWVLTGTWTLK